MKPARLSSCFLRGYVMEDDRIVLRGPAGDLLQNPQVRDAYFGGGRETPASV